MHRIFLFAAILTLGACDQEMSPDAQRHMDAALEQVRGQMALSINRQSYDAITIGTSYAEAVAVLGEGEEVTRSTVAGQDIIIYQWVRPDGGNIALTFNDGALVSKSQAGLT